MISSTRVVRPGGVIEELQPTAFVAPRPLVAHSQLRDNFIALNDLLPDPWPETDFGKPVFKKDSIEYKRLEGNWEPPGPVEGFKPDATNKWLLHSLWPECPKRLYGILGPRPCGCIGVMAMCKNAESPLNGLLVKLKDCEQCPLKS